MRATQPDSITKFIKSNELTFVIPVYQRNYVWKVEDCEKLFDDILDGVHNKRKHYFGNVVYYEDGRDPFSGFTRYVLIDGQQRITSTMLLLTAIRDEEEDEENKKKLTTAYLTNENAEESFRVKLKQVETDRIVYEAIIDGRIENLNKSSVIYRNYNKFRNLVKKAKTEEGLTSADLLDGIAYLNIIAIDLESNSEGAESPQVIFESINATGEPLSTADLLRNFLLLEVGTDRQTEFYKIYWLLIEKNIGNENVSDFIRRYITLKSTVDIRKDTEYKEFKKNYREYFKDAEDAIKELAKFSKYYRWIKHPEVIAKEFPKTSKILQDLDDLRMLPATPAIMWLLEKADAGVITFKDVNDTLDVIASWSFRARITNIITTGEIGTILTTKILELFKNKQNDDSYADFIWFELSNYRLHDIYASDAMFKDAFQRYDFYKNYRRYVQQKLSSFISNDQTEIVLESIEHIMPQTIRPDKWPGISQSEHVEWVNSIGNLTPLNMPDNISNSNHSFADKIENIKNSDWQITREVDTANGWGIEAILQRGNTLATTATSIWRAPAERVREVELAQKRGKKLTQKFFDWIEEFDLPYITVDIDHSSNAFLRFNTDQLSQLIPKRTENDGGWRSGQAYYYEIKTDNTGWTRVNLAFNAENTTDEQQLGQQVIMDVLNKYPSKEAWTWFNPIGWTLNFDEGDEVLKDDLRRILEEVIPSFEIEISEAESMTPVSSRMVA
jgi:uncharacterized protein with ParB-like and HNH nuclease domain